MAGKVKAKLPNVNPPRLRVGARRTINIGDYESLVFECSFEEDTDIVTCEQHFSDLRDWVSHRLDEWCSAEIEDLELPPKAGQMARSFVK